MCTWVVTSAGTLATVGIAEARPSVPVSMIETTITTATTATTRTSSRSSALRWVKVARRIRAHRLRSRRSVPM